MKIAFIIGSAIQSGGTYVIFRHAIATMRAGHEVSMVLEYPVKPEKLQWYPEAESLRFRTVAEMKKETVDLAIATWWETAYLLCRINAKHYAYFVQSIESKFYDENQSALIGYAEKSYQLPLHFITEATWIERYLNSRYGKEARVVLNGIDKEMFTAEGNRIADRDPSKLRVLIEGTVDVAFKNVPKTVELCKKSNADEIWLLTTTKLDNYLVVDCVFSHLSVAECPQVYRSCDVLVKLSYVEGMFAPPLEMFHCGGTAITYDVTGADEYLRDGENAFVIKTDDEQGVVSAINRLKADRDLLNRLKQNAAETAKNWPNWEMSSQKFVLALEEIVRETPQTTQVELQEKTKQLTSEYCKAEKAKLAQMPKKSALARGLKLYLMEHHPAILSAIKGLRS